MNGGLSCLSNKHDFNLLYYIFLSVETDQSYFISSILSQNFQAPEHSFVLKSEAFINTV